MTSEDCLSLNVFTPAGDGGRRAVIVWIFGGAYSNGDAADPLFDGTRLARQEDVVVVTFNYRLGALGFARIADANCGLADQIAALRFVHDHIERFGGDPNCVTVVGESAGAMSVCNLLSAPAAAGLFHRAIAQSGAAGNVATPAAAEQTAACFRRALGASTPGTAPVVKILSAQTQAARELGPQQRAFPFRPCVDGSLLPGHPLTRAGQSTIPLILGMNAHENRLYVRPSLKLSDAALEVRIAKRVPTDQVRAVIDHYRNERATVTINPNAAILSDVDTELRFRQPMLRYARARHAPTWLYQFDWPSPALRGWLGACHAVEIPFVFGNFDLPGTAKFVGYDAEAEQLAARVMSLWGRFARDGHPGAHWPAYDPRNEQQLHLNREIYTAALADDPTFRFWREQIS
jgi:para-nitrobenzyl esterase